MYDVMKFGTILADKMREPVETTHLGCGVSWVLGGVGVHQHFLAMGSLNPKGGQSL